MRPRTILLCINFNRQSMWIGFVEDTRTAVIAGRVYNLYGDKIMILYSFREPFAFRFSKRIFFFSIRPFIRAVFR